jgi:hypothetical protein
MAPPRKPVEATTPTTLTGALLDHLLASTGKARRVGPVQFAVTGHGPFAEDEVTRVLVARDREVYFADSLVGAIVVGRADWKQGLDESLDAHRGVQLKVYTHEMLLTMFLTREDPYTRDVDHIRVLYGDHPALRYLDEPKLFDWPSLRVPEGPGPTTEDALRRDQLQAKGILTAFGYNVGRVGDRQLDRRRALKRAYLNAATARAPKAVRERLAEPNTPARLRQVAYAIAAQWRLAIRRRRADMSTALEHWRADLTWLKSTYYDTLDPPDFHWPDLS